MQALCVVAVVAMEVSDKHPVSSRTLPAVTNQVPEVFPVALAEVGGASGEASGEVPDQVIGTVTDCSRLAVHKGLKYQAHEVRAPDPPLARLSIDPFQQRFRNAK